MKKTLSLIITGLLIVCMAGSAIATDTNLIPNDQVTVYPGSTGDITVNVASFPAGDYNLKLEVSGTGLSASFIDPTEELYLPGTATPGSPIDGSVHIDGNHQATIRISRSAGTQIGAVTVSFKDVNLLITDKVTVSAETVRVNAPEFPTVALPVAAMIGLIFVFGRKKEGL